MIFEINSEQKFFTILLKIQTFFSKFLSTLLSKKTFSIFAADGHLSQF